VVITTRLTIGLLLTVISVTERLDMGRFKELALEREDFEEWYTVCVSHYSDMAFEFDRMEYVDNNVDLCWRAWKAAKGFE